MKVADVERGKTFFPFEVTAKSDVESSVFLCVNEIPRDSSRKLCLAIFSTARLYWPPAAILVWNYSGGAKACKDLRGINWEIRSTVALIRNVVLYSFRMLRSYVSVELEKFHAPQLL